MCRTTVAQGHVPGSERPQGEVVMRREEEEPHLGARSVSCEKHYEPGTQQGSGAGGHGIAERLVGHFCFIQVPNHPCQPNRCQTGWLSC